MLIFCKGFLITCANNAPFEQQQTKTSWVHSRSSYDDIQWSYHLTQGALSSSLGIWAQASLLPLTGCQVTCMSKVTQSHTSPLLTYSHSCRQELLSSSSLTLHSSALLRSLALGLRTVLYRVSCRLNIFKWIWILWITEQQREQK